MKVLVVDDEKDIQMLFEQWFRKEIRNREIEFVFAFSGEEALEHMSNLKHKFVLILSDINMPGISGLELLKKIKAKYSQPPPVVMMITAYGDAENHDTATLLGADDFLTKPLNFGLLKEKFKNMQ